MFRSGTRQAALSRVERGTAADWGEGTRRQAELLAYFQGTLPPAGRQALEDHLAHCRSCADALRRLAAAEPAFSQGHPPLATAVAQQSLTAMAHAAPVTAHGRNAGAVSEAALRLFLGEVQPAEDAAIQESSAPAPEPAPVRSPPVEPPPEPEPVRSADAAPPSSAAAEKLPIEILGAVARPPADGAKGRARQRARQRRERQWRADPAWEPAVTGRRRTAG